MRTREKNSTWKQSLHRYREFAFSFMRSESKYHEKFYEGSKKMCIFVSERQYYCTHIFVN